MFYYQRCLIIIVILFFGSFPIFSQDIQNAVPDTTNLMNDSLNRHHKLTDFVEAYGSYRIGFGCNNQGQIGMSDNASRFGIFGVLPVSESIGLHMFAQVELGLNRQGFCYSFRSRLSAGGGRQHPLFPAWSSGTGS